MVQSNNGSRSLFQRIFPSGSQGEEEGEGSHRSGPRLAEEEGSIDGCGHEGHRQVGKVVFQMAHVWLKIPHGLIDEIVTPPV